MWLLLQEVRIEETASDWVIPLNLSTVEVVQAYFRGINRLPFLLPEHKITCFPGLVLIDVLKRCCSRYSSSFRDQCCGSRVRKHARETIATRPRKFIWLFCFRLRAVIARMQLFYPMLLWLIKPYPGSAAIQSHRTLVLRVKFQTCWREWIKFRNQVLQLLNYSVLVICFMGN